MGNLREEKRMKHEEKKNSHVKCEGTWIKNGEGQGRQIFEEKDIFMWNDQGRRVSNPIVFLKQKMH